MAELIIKKKRPKNLDLASIRLPLPGKVSILHRVSGVGLFLFLPLLLWMFSASLASVESFADFKALAGSLPVKVVMAGLIWAFIHHFCAGVRFLLLDLHIGIEKEAANKSAAIVLAVSIPLTLIVWGGVAVINRTLVGAHYGLKDWIVQRATAVIMAVYSVLMVAVLLVVRPGTFESWHGVFSNGPVKFLTFLFFVSLFYHAWIGVRDIWMDYVKPTGLRLSLHVLTVTLLVGYTAWAAAILWRL